MMWIMLDIMDKFVNLIFLRALAVVCVSYSGTDTAVPNGNCGRMPVEIFFTSLFRRKL